jgi:hypothetical protein
MGNVSGRLTLVGRRGERRLDFRDGRVCFVSSTVPEERLGSWIAARTQLNVADLRRVLASSMLQRKLFTDLLLAQGLIGSAELRSGLTDLAEAVTGRVLLTSEVEFTFDPDHPVVDVLGLSLDVAPSQLLLEAARRSDELVSNSAGRDPQELPLGGEAFESFFWDLIQDGISTDDPVSGDQLTAFHDQAQDIVNTLAQWLASSPGLVPLPATQITAVAESLAGRDPGELYGLAHTTWDQMVLARLIHTPGDRGPLTMGELEKAAMEVDVWSDLLSAEFLARPDAGRLDRLIRRLVNLWSRTSAAAAPHLGVDPRTATLAVHLATVPTDLVLWVLTTLPVPHRSLRKALLNHLSKRVAAQLARLADFPPAFREVLQPKTPTRLGVCLDFGRRCLPAVAGWPKTVPEGSDEAAGIASKAVLALAEDAARQAADETDVDLLAIG